MRHVSVFSASLFTVSICFSAQPVAACWIAPPTIQKEETPDGRFIIERHNDQAKVRIHSKATQQLMWSAEIEGFDSLFSRFYLMRDGTRLVHVRGNHIVNDKADVAIATYYQDGRVRRLSASDFVQSLVTPAQLHPGYRISTQPGHYWLDRVEKVNDRELTVVVTGGAHRTLHF